MKKVAFFVGIILSFIIAADVLWGVLTRYYVSHYTLPGDYETMDYLLKSADEDVIVLGSSIALNSTIPQEISDSLHLTVWNGACNGQHLPYFETILQCILSHHTPQMILLGLRPEELTIADKGARYNMLFPYYHMGFSTLDKYLETGDSVERLLLHSALYRYNTIWFRLLLYHFISPGENGFIAKPLPRQFPTMLSSGSKQPDPEAEAILCRMVELCKEANVQLIVYFPPVYKQIQQPIAALERTKQICSQNDVPCYDAAQDSVFLQHPEWYYDNAHLNLTGARQFSCQFSHWLTYYKR